MKGSKRHNRHRTPKVINKGLDYELLAKNVFLLQKNRDIILAHEDMRNCIKMSKIMFALIIVI